MKELAEEIMEEMNKIDYVPVTAEAQVVIAYQLSRLVDLLTASKGTASF